MSATTTDADEQDPCQRVVLLLGSNVDADAQLDRALAALADEFPVTAVSVRHGSDASTPGAPPYQNQALVLLSALDRESLKTRLRRIEAALGRRRPAVDARLCAIDIDAIGRFAPGFEVWDTKGYSAAYARKPLADVGVPGAG